MNMQVFVSSLTQFEKEELIKALTPDNTSLFPLLIEIQAYNRGDRVSAIVEYRRRTNTGLREAKDAIEASVKHYNRTGVVRS